MATKVAKHATVNLAMANPLDSRDLKENCAT